MSRLLVESHSHLPLASRRSSWQDGVDVTLAQGRNSLFLATLSIRLADSIPRNSARNSAINSRHGAAALYDRGRQCHVWRSPSKR